MTLRSGSIALVLVLVTAARLHGQAQYVPIPNATTAMDITPGGELVVGTGVNPLTSNSEAYYWRWKVDPAPTFLGAAEAVAVSDDGMVIAGTTFDSGIGAKVAARWTLATGWQSLGGLPNAQNCPSRSEATDISGDGTTIVGFSNDNCSERAFLWSQSTGMVQLEALGGGHNRALVISADGSKIAGFGQGTFGNTPATWDPTNPSAGGSMINVAMSGEALGMTDDGSTIVGRVQEYCFFCEAGCVQPPIWLAMEWEWDCNAVDISNDGLRIIGHDTSGHQGSAWLFEKGVTVLPLQTWLSNAGVAGVPQLGKVSRMTPDGSVMVGRTMFGGAWIAVIPAAAAHVLPGCTVNNPGSMVVTGTPTPGSTVTLGLHNPVGSQPIGSNTLLLLSLDRVPACGALVPGLGMNPGPGELMLDIGAGSSLGAFGGAPWNGTPSNFPLTIPTIPQVVGLTFYAQGALLPPAFPGKSALTDAAIVRIGLY